MNGVRRHWSSREQGETCKLEILHTLTRVPVWQFEAPSSNGQFQYLTLQISNRNKNVHLDPSDCVLVRVEARDQPQNDVGSSLAGGHSQNADGGSSTTTGAHNGASGSAAERRVQGRRGDRQFHGVVVSGAQRPTRAMCNS
jgi:hypothetical protein